MSMVAMLEYLTTSKQVESLFGEKPTATAAPTINNTHENLGSGIETNIGSDVGTSETKI